MLRTPVSNCWTVIEIGLEKRQLEITNIMESNNMIFKKFILKTVLWKWIYLFDMPLTNCRTHQ